MPAGEMLPLPWPRPAGDVRRARCAASRGEPKARARGGRTVRIAAQTEAREPSRTRSRQPSRHHQRRAKPSPQSSQRLPRLQLLLVRRCRTCCATRSDSASVRARIRRRARRNRPATHRRGRAWSRVSMRMRERGAGRSPASLPPPPRAAANSISPAATTSSTHPRSDPRQPLRLNKIGLRTVGDLLDADAQYIAETLAVRHITTQHRSATGRTRHGWSSRSRISAAPTHSSSSGRGSAMLRPSPPPHPTTSAPLFWPMPHHPKANGSCGTAIRPISRRLSPGAPPPRRPAPHNPRDPSPQVAPRA